MDDKILALLGDRSAQERITERGELLPCQCGGIAELVFQKRGSLLLYKNNLYTVEGLKSESNTKWCKYAVCEGDRKANEAR